MIKNIARHKSRSIHYAKTASDILHTSQQARELFVRLEVEDKRALFKFLLSEPRLDNGKFVFAYQKPFDKVHEIATFQPQKNEMPQGEIGHLLPFYPARLPGQDDFPTNLSSVDMLALFQEWFGILEFPATFAREAERFASMKLYEESSLPMAA